jgi:hypothetical protein
MAQPGPERHHGPDAGWGGAVFWAGLLLLLVAWVAAAMRPEARARRAAKAAAHAEAVARVRCPTCDAADPEETTLNDQVGFSRSGGRWGVFVMPKTNSFRCRACGHLW